MSLNRATKVIKGLISLSLVGLLSLSLTSCMSGHDIQRKAEQNFQVFLENKNKNLPTELQIKMIQCSGQDSPSGSTGDGYVSCTGQNNVGKEFIYKCSYGYSPWDATSCKADVANVLQYPNSTTTTK